MRRSARQRGLQQGQKTYRRIARRLVLSLPPRQFAQRPPIAPLQLLLFSPADGAYHRRKFQEDLHAVLQLRHRRRAAGMSRTPLALAADLQHLSVRALLHFLITARQPNHESAHRGSDPAYEACYTAAASPWLRI